jgi:predicted transcriptional regulator
MVRKSIRISSQSVSSELTMLPSIESVKQQRLKISMTQKELANLVGVSTSMINQIESGRSAPSYNTAKRIFEVLATKENESSTHNAGELCSQDIIKLKPANTLHDAIKKMHNGQISQIPIFDGAIPVGIISESGIVEQSANGNIEIAKKIRVQDIMEPTPPVVDFETPANTLAPLIKYSKCILVRKGSKIFGIITASDTLKMME